MEGLLSTGPTFSRALSGNYSHNFRYHDRIGYDKTFVLLTLTRDIIIIICHQTHMNLKALNRVKLLLLDDFKI